MKLIYKHIAQQFENSVGFGGKTSTIAMNFLNQKRHKIIVEKNDIQATDTIFEIGFGNGYLLHKLSNNNPQKIYGIEISADMLKIATRKNKKKIEQGKMELLLADIQNLPLDDFSIDKAYTINTVYFWKNIDKRFSEIKRILKPNGIVINILYLKKYLDKLPITQYGFSKFIFEQSKEITAENGLKTDYIFEIESKKSICVIARKEEKC